MAIRVNLDVMMAKRKISLGELAEKLAAELKAKEKGLSGMDTLSMGMSGDYATAVKYGSNIVRIGSGLFGYRSYIK